MASTLDLVQRRGRGQSIRRVMLGSIAWLARCDEAAENVHRQLVAIMDAPGADPVVQVAAARVLSDMQARARDAAIKAVEIAVAEGVDVIDADGEEVEMPDAATAEARLMRLVQGGG